MSHKRPDLDTALEAGTTQLYRDPLYYDYEYEGRVEDVRWYLKRYQEADGAVLELGVGTGRIAARAVRQGATVLGLDMSPTMLARAMGRKKILPKVRQPFMQLVRGDMRRFAFGQKFPLITCPFNAFQHLYTRQDVEDCLRCVREHLEPDGIFLLDVLMPDLEYLSRPAFKRYPGIRFKHPSLKAHYLYSEKASYDPAKQVHQMYFIYDRSEESAEAPPGPESFEVQLSHRYFYPAELEALLHYNGFEVLMRFGDFEEGELRADSESQVVMCCLR